MKALIYTIGIVSIIIASLHLMAPKSFNVEKQIIVEQDINLVFTNLCSLKEQWKWSPWADIDPNIKISYRGDDSKVGFCSSWIGNKEIGEGEQEITKIIKNKLICTELRFEKPYKSTSKTFMKLRRLNKGTELNWSVSGDYSFPTNIIMLFINMEENLGKDLEKGLRNFKAHISQKEKEQIINANIASL
ncbi:MAG: SRPBCC family protein [Marinifilaceae bacterium]|jgi:hypothetical protein|nr:SRPBCC family protein [Marinifilaceae bacterium]